MKTVAIQLEGPWGGGAFVEPLTRSALNALVAGATVVPNQLYRLTDESRLVMGVTSTTFKEFVNAGELVDNTARNLAVVLGS